MFDCNSDVSRKEERENHMMFLSEEKNCMYNYLGVHLKKTNNDRKATLQCMSVQSLKSIDSLVQRDKNLLLVIPSWIMPWNRRMMGLRDPTYEISFPQGIFHRDWSRISTVA